MELEANKSAIELECRAECLLHWKGRQASVSMEDLPLSALVRHILAL